MAVGLWPLPPSSKLITLIYHHFIFSSDWFLLHPFYKNYWGCIRPTRIISLSQDLLRNHTCKVIFAIWCNIHRFWGLGHACNLGTIIHPQLYIRIVSFSSFRAFLLLLLMKYTGFSGWEIWEGKDNKDRMYTVVHVSCLTCWTEFLLGKDMNRLTIWLKGSSSATNLQVLRYSYTLWNSREYAFPSLLRNQFCSVPSSIGKIVFSICSELMTWNICENINK